MLFDRRASGGKAESVPCSVVEYPQAVLAYMCAKHLSLVVYVYAWQDTTGAQ
jgi:hypothetical protein